MNFDTPHLHFQPDELEWLVEDMPYNLIEQTEHVAAELRGYLVAADSTGKRTVWLRYDTQHEVWMAVKNWQALQLIHTVTYAWYKGIARYNDPNLIAHAVPFFMMTAARQIRELLPDYLPAQPSNFIPAKRG